MTSIAQLRHRVHLCSQKDVVVEGTLRLNREGVLSMWAMVEAKAASAFAPTGAVVNDQRNKRTHIITTRYHRDLDVSVMAWIYEARLKSAPRWFKVLKVTQSEQGGSEFFKFECRIVESAADIVEPVPEKDQHPSLVMGLPPGVKL